MNRVLRVFGYLCLVCLWQDLEIRLIEKICAPYRFQFPFYSKVADLDKHLPGDYLQIELPKDLPDREKWGLKHLKPLNESIGTTADYSDHP